MIAFYEAAQVKNQETYLTDCLRSGNLAGDGPMAQAVLALLREKLGVQNALLTPSASHALELCFWHLAPGDEVVLPAYNFPAAASAVLRAGGKPVLCDIDPNTQNASPADILNRVTARTRAVCLTHYAGIACDMDALLPLRESGVALVEDAAQGVGAFYRSQALGTVGDFGCYSFHATKNVACGEGGAYLQRENNALFDRAVQIRDKGTNRRDFLAGTVSRYQWERVGSSLLMPELCAAVLRAQLEALEEITTRRLRVAGWYDERLESAFERGRLLPMGITPGARGNGHIYYVKFESAAARERAQAGLGAAGIPALTHFVPLHLGAMGRELGYRPGDFPESERTFETLLRLPIHTGLTEDQADFICRTLEALL